MRQYYYLIASLPFLEFGIKPPILYRDFLAFSREQLSESDMKILKEATIEPSGDVKGVMSALKEWNIFDMTLRNEIARQRASKMSKEPEKYIRGENHQDPFLAQSAHWAISQESPIEAERFLDKIRWEKIEELARGHYFDMDFLITYALKLQILERWERINREGGMEVLQDLVTV